jgi:glutamate-1-semialdehyde 2,1-aminomutase
VWDVLLKRYLERSPRSHQAWEQALRYVPGGVQGGIKFYPPYPLTFQRAEGATLVDVDGQRYVDYLLSFGALILGHGHPVVRRAIEQTWDTAGTSSFGMPTPREVELAEVVTRLYPSIEALRLTNSGLEATLLAVRIGLAATGRTHLAKFEGHYHGGHDQVLVSVNPSPEAAGDVHRPRAVSDSFGLPDYIQEHTVVLPFNDADNVEAILTTHRHDVGVVILEPVAAGVIPAEQVFLHRLRELTQHLGMVLVFDEVKTGFRVRLGGAQEYYGVRPDLTALGKVLGGGFPIGAVGGRRDLLALTAPAGSPGARDPVFHSGTFNGNPMSVAAGLATLSYLQEPGIFDGLLQRTATLRHAIEAAGRDEGFDVTTVGVGTMFDVLFTTETVSEYRSWSRADRQRRRALDFLLMERGIFSKPLNRFSLSVAHTDEMIERTAEAFRDSFHALKNLEGMETPNSERTTLPRGVEA